MTKFSGVIPAALAYTAAKGAVEQMTRVLAKDLGARGITVNTIAPGSVETEMLHKGKGPEVIKHLASLNPQKRIPEASEIAPIIAFLAREEAGWVNGQTIFVNGVSFGLRSRAQDANDTRVQLFDSTRRNLSGSCCRPKYIAYRWNHTVKKKDSIQGS